MKSLQALGWKKAVGFIFFSLIAKLLHWCIVPQLRVFLMNAAGAKIGRDSVVFDVSFFNLYHYGFSRLTIGSSCFLGDEVMLDMRGHIVLEDHVTVSNRAMVLTHINVGYKDHPLQSRYPTSVKPVLLKQGVYIGTGAIIMPGVTVGEESVVGAGAVVTKDVPARTVVAGVPARKIREIRGIRKIREFT